MTEIVGYLTWRRTPKGTAACSKVDKEIRDWKLRSPNNFEIAQHHATLLAEFPLWEEQWSIPLDELAKRHPCPPFKRTV